MIDEKIQSPRVSMLVNKRLNERGLTRSDFIRKFQSDHRGTGSRNHLFKILNGQVIAGERGLLPLICESLGLDLEEMIKAVRADKIEAKDWASAAPKANRIQQQVVTIMDTLSKRDQEDILLFARMKAKR